MISELSDNEKNELCYKTKLFFDSYYCDVEGEPILSCSDCPYNVEV